MSNGTDTEAKRGRPVLDYLVFVAWCAPAFLAAAFAQIYLVPKMEKVIEHTQTDSDSMEDVGKIVVSVPKLLSFYSAALLLVVGVLIVILELAAKWWPCCRRTCLMIVAWLVNVTTLIGLLLLAVAILLFVMA